MKTINDLKLGDSVWFEGEEYQFGGYSQGAYHRYVCLCQNNERKEIALEKQIQLTKPLPELEKGQPIFVWDSHALEHPRIFSHFTQDQRVVTFNRTWYYNGTTWFSWRLPTKRELEYAGFNPERWQFRDEED